MTAFFRSTPSGRPNSLQLFGAIGLCLLVGALGSVFTASSVASWYPNLIKPNWTPPSSVFGPVWTALYVLMGISLAFYLVSPRETGKKWAMRWFWTQLALNLSWSAAFFGLRSESLGYIVICALWMAIVALLWTGSKISRAATWLLVPYFLWVTFASCLNFAILGYNVLKPKTQAMDAMKENQDPFYLMRKPTPRPQDFQPPN